MKIVTYNNQTIDLNLPTGVDATNLIALPGVIDPHAHFRVPGWEHKEDWQTGAAAAVAGGVTTVLEMPNNVPPITTYKLLKQKKELINKQLAEAGIPLNYYLYFGATDNNLAEIKKAKDEIVGLKLFMGSSTGNLLVSKLNAQEQIFALAAKLNLVVAVHAENEEEIKNQKLALSQVEGSKIKNLTVSDHSVIRGRKAAIIAVTQAINLAKKYGTKLYILHCSTKEEVEIIRQAKKEGIKVFAEVTPHHLFLNISAYKMLGTLAQMNPPLREPLDQEALWVGINDGTIDTVGTDHAPHTLAEKALPYPQSPSGVPGIETSLSLLLNSCNEGKLTLKKIVELTSLNSQTIFNLPKTNSWTIVNLGLAKTVNNDKLKTKCGWSPFNGFKLKGWPVYTVINGEIFSI